MNATAKYNMTLDAGRFIKNKKYSYTEKDKIYTIETEEKNKQTLYSKEFYALFSPINR